MRVGIGSGFFFLNDRIQIRLISIRIRNWIYTYFNLDPNTFVLLVANLILNSLKLVDCLRINYSDKLQAGNITQENFLTTFTVRTRVSFIMIS